MLLITDHAIPGPRSLHFASLANFRRLVEEVRQINSTAVASLWKICDLRQYNGLCSPRGEQAMADLTLAELDRRIAAIRQNIRDLVEQAAAYSGAGDESRAADRIAQQEQELRRLIALRDKISS
jgi:hypothetical protein